MSRDARRKELAAKLHRVTQVREREARAKAARSKRALTESQQELAAVDADLEDAAAARSRGTDGASLAMADASREALLLRRQAAEAVVDERAEDHADQAAEHRRWVRQEAKADAVRQAARSRHRRAVDAALEEEMAETAATRGGDSEPDGLV